MPQASDEMRDLMGKWFGDRISDSGPMRYLESKGYKLDKKWEWECPTSSHRPNCYDVMCVMFLIHEWDFGGFVGGGDTLCVCGGSLAEIV